MWGWWPRIHWVMESWNGLLLGNARPLVRVALLVVIPGLWHWQVVIESFSFKRHKFFENPPWFPVTHCCQCLENLNIWKKILETILNGSQDARCVALRKISSQMIPHGMPSFPRGCPDSGSTICHHCFYSMWMNCHAMGRCSHGYATLGESGNLPSTEISHHSRPPVRVTHIHTHKKRNTQIA